MTKPLPRGRSPSPSVPNQADPHFLLAMYLSHTGRYKEALPLVRKAMRLDPYYPSYLPASIGRRLFANGRV